jgi:hypothetical protein
MSDAKSEPQLSASLERTRSGLIQAIADKDTKVSSGRVAVMFSKEGMEDQLIVSRTAESYRRLDRRHWLCSKCGGDFEIALKH